MSGVSKYVISLVAVGGLLASVLTDAMASKPSPLHPAMRSGRTFTMNGNVNVNGVLKVSKNANVTGNLYARGKAEIYKGLTIRDKGLTVKAGGIAADALHVTGVIQADQGVVSANVQGQTIQGTSISGGTLSLTGAATVGGALTATGKLTSNGVDAGAGGLSTTGNVTTAGLSANNITASSANLGGLTVTGNVDLSKANVTGLNLSSLNLNNLTFQNLAVGSTASNTPPFSLSQNGRTSQIGVDTNGAITVGALTTSGNLTVGGNFTVLGSSTLTAGSLTAPVASGTANPGALTLTGNPINLTGATNITGAANISGNLAVGGTTNLNGTTTLSGPNDLILSGQTSGTSSTTSPSHLLASLNPDVAGQITVSTANNAPGVTSPAAGPFTNIYQFKRTYTTLPIVTVTAANGDPNPGSPFAPKVWVTVAGSSSGGYTSFTINYVPATPTPVGGAGNTFTYNYHVIGSS